MTPSPSPSIAIVDYGMGNRRSVEKAFAQLGARVQLTGDPDRLAAADGLVLPGVGAFAAGIDALRARGLDAVVRDWGAAGGPLLGVCLGMQMLFDSSCERGLETAGLGLIEGSVRPLDARGLRLPHIGWNDVRFDRPSPLTSGLPAAGAPFYHVHSFVADPAHDEHVIATAEYGERFATIVGSANVYGVQFHPEKSSRDGLGLLAAFCRLAADRVGAIA